MKSDKTQYTLDQEAAAWVAKFNSQTVTREDREQFSRWIAISPAHRQRFFTMRERWQTIGQAAQLPGPMQRKTAFYRHRLLAAASILLAVMLSAIYPALRDNLNADAVAAVGEHKTLRLEDGSILHLNTDTAVAIDFSPEQRRIRLLRGEAEIEVAHAPSRPLIMASGAVEAMALGTDFSVASVNGELKVTVFESSVQVSKDGDMLDILKPGQQLTFAGPEQIMQKSAVDLQQVNAWRDGKLIFTAKPLQQVVEEINRYRSGHLFLLNRQLAGRPVSGIFDIRQLDNNLFVLAEMLGLKVVQANGYPIALY
ncbi:hypothetical protein [Methylomonas albis]|uniref:FecR family protein n=1 Tax=Methylomonas albis TaxID=1854563 RepID=A0ABR9CYL7_9GAMM|nr:FecR family protein [Methylomonas albis]MBD9355830.1 FecR family protein [Methylomonas albis]CAD6878854.1 hypothetical protein [Methylomonas albis]